MFSKLDIKSFLIALPTGLVIANAALAADRPANPADWPALKDVYKNYFLIGSTNLDARNFGAEVVPGENSVAAMTLKHYNAVTPSNAMKPDFWNGGASNPTPNFLTNLTSGINADISAANARGVMQVMPGTWDYVQQNLAQRKLNPASAHDNVTAGVLYLKQLLNQTGGNESDAIAAYYQGLGALRSRGVFDDTKQYIANVQALRGRFGG